MQDTRICWSNRGHDYIQDEIDAVVEAMRSANPLTQGEYLKAFEAKFGDYLGSGQAFAVANGSNALDIAALLSGIKPGDEVYLA